MIELIIGFALGGVAFTEKGRELGNKAFDMVAKEVKKIGANNREAKQDD